MPVWLRAAFSSAVVGVVLTAGGVMGAVLDRGEQDAAFVIDAFEQRITVDRDGTPRVAERIDVTFTEPRRGILRDLHDDAPFPSRGTYRDVEVTGAPGGGEWHHEVERIPGQLGRRIRIGEAARPLDPGSYRYDIAYTAPTLTVTLEDDPELVELRVDAPGFEWATSIGPTTVTIELPAEPTSVACIAGPRGGTRPCPQTPEIVGRSVVAELGPFAPWRSATLSVLLPAAAFSEAPPRFAPEALDASEGLGPWDLNNAAAGLVLTLALAVPLLLWELVAWRMHYRDRVTDPELHNRATPTALPAPPHGLRPPEVAGLLRRRNGEDLLLSAIVDLEQRGLLVSTATEEHRSGWSSRSSGTFTLERPQCGASPGPDDAALLAALIPEDGATVFDGTYRSEVARRTTDVQKLLTDRAFGVYRAHGFTHERSGLVGRTAFRVAALLAWVGWAAAAVWAVWSATPLPLGVAVAVAVVVLFGWALAHAPWSRHRMPLNSQGRHARAQAEAFDRYLRSVEGEQVEWAAGQPGIDHHHPALALLPYAIALGHAQSWYQRFGPLMRSLVSVPATSGDGYHASAGAAAWWASNTSFAQVRTTQKATCTPTSNNDDSLGYGGGGSDAGGGGGGGSGGGGGGGSSW